jgi:O-methyltransferase
MNNIEKIYLNLLKQCLTYYIWGETIQPIEITEFNRFKKLLMTIFLKVFGNNVKLVKSFSFDPEKRREGLDWPPLAHTMVGLKRLDNLQFCIEDVIKNNVPGDLIETGVWRGGASILMRGVLKAYNISDRNVWLADSFEGLPVPNPEKYPNDRDDNHHKISYLAVSMEEVKSNFEKYDLLDSQVKFLKGWFKDTLPNAPIEKLAVIRLDGDMYESTINSLENLYPKLSKGGYLIVDDYALENCRKAVQDFRSAHQINDEIIKIDSIGVYWQRK